ncbi:MAG: DNA-binding transcriptional regulator [Patescibacteria group bacterium]|nr:DNA-binding transcriptional regulator [Patescibacteria group bacterium]
MVKIRRVAVVCNLTRPYDRGIIRGIAHYMHEVGNWSLYAEEDPIQKLPELGFWDGDGLIVDFDDRKVAAALRKVDKPVVGIGGGYGWYDPSSNIPYLITDNAKIGRMAADHLLECGLTRFAFCGFARTRVNGWAAERARAFVAQIRRQGHPCSVYTGTQASARRWRDMQQGLVDWLRTLTFPLGLMACNDARARHVLEACRTLELRVPDDVALIGVDNDEIMCELTRPPLTSVEQGTFQMGYEAAALLDRLMAGRRPGRKEFLIPPERLVARQSTDVLAVDDPDVAAAIRFIRAHACEGIGLPDVLQQVAVSCSTLEKRFRTSLGRTIHSEIQRVQIERIKQLLDTTSLSIQQIMRRAGFNYVQYMTTLFRRTTGYTPAEYRGRKMGLAKNA